MYAGSDVKTDACMNLENMAKSAKGRLMGGSRCLFVNWNYWMMDVADGGVKINCALYEMTKWKNRSDSFRQ